MSRCPLKSAHTRMKEMILHLNRAFKDSKSVTDFTINYNAFLNSAGSFKYVVYHQIKKLDDYKRLKKEWFEDVEQLFILFNSRNLVVHEDDVQFSSTYDIKVYCGYEEIYSTCLVGKPVFESKYLDSIIESLGNNKDYDGYYVRITPKWVSEQYGGIDLIEYAQDAYEHMSRILESAHEVLGYLGKCSELESDCYENEPMNISTPPCFTSYRNRDIWQVLSTGKRYNVGQNLTDFGGYSDAAVERYGKNKIYVGGAPDSFSDEIVRYAESAKQIFKKDQYHITLAVLLSEKSVEIAGLKLEDEDSKRIIFIKLGDYVKRNKSNRVIIIGEGILKRYEYRDEGKKEIVYDTLMIVGVNNGGEMYSKIYRVINMGGNRIVGEELHEKSFEMPHLLHIKRALMGKE